MIADRIKTYEQRPKRDIRRNLFNFRTHSEAQLSALAGILRQTGWADALVCYEIDEDDDGHTLELIDGEARWSGADPDDMLPCLVLDVDVTEARELLLAMDPVSQMADIEPEALQALLAGTALDSGDGLEEMMRDLRFDAGVATEEDYAAGQVAPDGGKTDVTSSHPPADKFKQGTTKQFTFVLGPEEQELFRYWEENWTGEGAHHDMFVGILEQWDAAHGEQDRRAGTSSSGEHSSQPGELPEAQHGAEGDTGQTA